LKETLPKNSSNDKDLAIRLKKSIRNVNIRDFDSLIGEYDQRKCNFYFIISYLQFIINSIFQINKLSWERKGCANVEGYIRDCEILI
jgi:hypothetical protein